MESKHQRISHRDLHVHSLVRLNLIQEFQRLPENKLRVVLKDITLGDVVMHDFKL